MKTKKKPDFTWQNRLRPERIYIIPTRVGALFIAATLIILLIGSAYSNNLIHLLAFFMLSLVFVSMVLTNQQLKDLLVDSLQIERTFAEGEMQGKVTIKNQNTLPRFGIDLHLANFGESVTERKEIKPSTVTSLHFQHRAPTRGRKEVTRLRVSSVYPLGFFYTWKLISIPQTFLVYPKLAGSTELPAPEIIPLDQKKEDLQTSSLEKSAGDDFRGHRPYGFGDSARHIDWRAHARGRPLLIKELNEGGSPDLTFNWHSLRELSTEEKLSQLTLWIEEAQRLNLSFRLRLPHFESTEIEKCLGALAVFEGQP